MKPERSKERNSRCLDSAAVVRLCALVFLGSAQAHEARFYRVSGPVAVSIQCLSMDGFLTRANEPTDSTFIVQTASSLVAPVGWVGYVLVPVTNSTPTVHRTLDPNPPAGMALVPAGSFTMGDTLNNGVNDELPAHTVYVSAFNMDRHEVTKALWEEVHQWAIGHGYGFENTGTGKEGDHPVHTVNWYDVVK